ncbi:MAG: enoyl-CoA hydratase-related protein [bacterium]|nr:enoyl-CoA hydratase-related protein [bacterium]MCY4271670.1 enoyl-CoA hydratase-related protein [bacterium]
MGELVRIETGAAKGVATLRLDSPKRNHLGANLMADLHQAVEELSGRTDIRAIVVWGGPRVFSLGAEIDLLNGLDVDEARGQSREFNRVFRALELLPQITVSAVNGYALGGGCELAMATEFRLVGQGAVMGFPEIKLGSIPGAGGTQRLSRLVGITKAKELIYSGRNVWPEEALSIGLASTVFPDDDVYEEALKLAASYAEGPAATSIVKRAILEGYSLPLDDALEVEIEAFASCFATEDAQIGVASYFEKGPGKAKFTGR